ncbi:MAG: hypothetical protein H6R33_554 [Actinobacteria bacterium]|nr:hypothetical protein [Actinomycetota bacterium]
MFPGGGHRLASRMSDSGRSPVLVGLLFALGLAALSLLAFAVLQRGGDTPGTTAALTTTTTTTTGPTSSTTTEPGDTTTTDLPTTTSSTTTTTLVPLHEWVDRRTVGQPWGTTVTGLLTFRGNPTNSWYGTGPIPASPSVLWKYPDAPMGSSDDDGVPWTGVTWTGQPVIWQRPDGVTELIFGATDARLHFLDPVTGAELRDTYYVGTGGHIKGTPTLDPDGFPLIYFGARDHRLHIVALDQDEPVELWSVSADDEPEGRWWHDWDGSPRVVNDLLFEGCENSFYYVWKLNRAYDDDGNVTVDPELIYKLKTYDQALLDAISPSGYMATSVENSSALFEGRVYFANSAGRVYGLDIEKMLAGEDPIVFKYWVGDDVDGSILVDQEGMLYVPVEYERYNARAQELGQLIKLNPYEPDDPYVWGMFSITSPPYKGGMWTTPALGDGVVYAVTNRGFLVAVDQETGEETWSVDIGSGAFSGPHHMSSPIVIDDRLIVATAGGTMQSYDITDPRAPVLDWALTITAGSIEATPAAWNGMIYIGSRDGFLYAVGD